jgi:hypothetical protein
MALCAKERYVGLIWEQHSNFAACFDSPDRLFNSGAHLMGLLVPGSNGTDRDEGSLLPYGGQLLSANQPLILRAVIIGGSGHGVVPAIQQFVALRGLPMVPSQARPGRIPRSAASGWLTRSAKATLSSCTWPGSVLSERLTRPCGWIACGNVRDGELASRLSTAAKARSGGAASEPPAGIGHIRYPAPPLCLHKPKRQTYQTPFAQRFQPDGTVTEAAQVRIMAASLCVTPRLDRAGRVVAARSSVFRATRAIAAGLKQPGLDQYQNTVPRGAHLGDSVAHARHSTGALVRACPGAN